MTAGAVILGVMVLVVLALNPRGDDWVWFLRLRRPGWLSFEPLIPLIWLAIYACFAVSALLAWRSSTSWGLMVGYLGLLLLVQSYTWVLCRTRRLVNGTRVGLLGWVWGVALTLVVASLSSAAAWLLLPYLLWSPIGTLVTWRMQQLNR
jgi:tryptophan-rich sensory protein